MMVKYRELVRWQGQNMAKDMYAAYKKGEIKKLEDLLGMLWYRKRT